MINHNIEPFFYTVLYMLSVVETDGSLLTLRTLLKLLNMLLNVYVLLCCH